MNLIPKVASKKLVMNRREALKRTALIVGSALTPGMLRALAETDRSGLSGGADWQPINFTPPQAEVLDHVTEIIIPRTDTVGARDVGVAPFIDFLCGDYMGTSEQKTLATGLDKWAEAGFSRKTAAEQTRVMSALIKNGTAADRKWLARVRSLTLSSYFTSEEVVKTVLRYDPIPGSYRGCVPISETGNVIMSGPG